VRAALDVGAEVAENKGGSLSLDESGPEENEHRAMSTTSEPKLAFRPRVALLESRMSRELARLVEKHGGEPVCAPAVRECHELKPEVAAQLITALSAGMHDIVVFMTGVAVATLFESAEALERRPELVDALRRLTTVCRGPKPTAALRGFGVVPTFTAREAFTSAEVIDVFAGIELSARRVLLFHYGERSDSLAETLVAREAIVHEQWLYRWHMPDDTGPLEALVECIVRGEVDALAVTCQIQFRHLLQVAQRLNREQELLHALSDKVVVAAVGPTCRAILQVHGVEARVVPDHPKMGPLVVTLMRYLDQRMAGDGRPSSAPPAPFARGSTGQDGEGERPRVRTLLEEGGPERQTQT
jgi:uroporphyrinogen-III synthase